MELKDIASISGKGGLFKIVKPSRSGVIVESLDDKKKKMVVSAQNRVSTLNEVSIYTTTAEGSLPLKDVFRRIYKEFEWDPGVGSSSDSDELKAFFKHIVPEYDTEKVYDSDIKKVISWYKIITTQLPDFFREIIKEEEETGSPSQNTNNS